METTNRPELTEISSGNALKIFKATGKAGMEMPEHYSTEEAVIVIQKGSAVLSIDGLDHLLKQADVFSIPEGKVHSLHLEEDFKAIVIMPLTSKIQFKKPV